MSASLARTGDAVARRPIRGGYEHLTPLFAERATLPEDDPRRERLRDELIAGHLPVARHIARRYVHRGDNPEDLEQVASVGLVLAVDRFDPARGADFLSFAVPTISGEVLRYFRDRASPIRTPRRLRALQSMIYDAAAELGQRHRRAPRPSEIAGYLGLDVEAVLEALSAQGAAYTASLDEPAPDGGGPGDRPASRPPSPRSRRSSTWSSTAKPSRRCSPSSPTGSGGSSFCGSSVVSPRPRSARRSASRRCTSRGSSRAH